MSTVNPLLRHVLGALEAVLRCFGHAREHVTVIGGLAPPLLVPDPAGSPHVGTRDLDLCLTVALVSGTTNYYAEVAEELRRAGFTRSLDRRFRWQREGVAVDFLYPAAPDEAPMRTMLIGEQWETAALRSLGADFAALAVDFRALIEATRERVEFSAELDGASIPHAWVHVAGPAALVALKARALDSRNKHKDAYDIVWLLDERGPEAAAAGAVARVQGDPAAAAELRACADLVDDLFAEGRVGPVWYANFLNPGDDAEREHFERFAAETVAAFVVTIRELMP